MNRKLGRPPAEFWSMVDIKSEKECWLWKGGKTTRGYGCVWRNGKTQRAHRVAWELTNGAAAGNMFVCHRCDVPPCCNPAHLFLGTNGENNMDCIAKGRARRARGCDNASASLSPDGLVMLRRMLSDGYPQFLIARAIGCSWETVRTVALGLRYADVGVERGGK